MNAICQAVNNGMLNMRNAWNLSSTCRKFAHISTTVGLSATIGTTVTALFAQFNPVGYLNWPTSFFNCVWNNDLIDYICTPTSLYYLFLAGIGTAFTAAAAPLIGPLAAYPMIWRPARAANPGLLPAGVFLPPLALLPAAPVEEGPIN